MSEANVAMPGVRGLRSSGAAKLEVRAEGGVGSVRRREEEKSQKRGVWDRTVAFAVSWNSLGQMFSLLPFNGEPPAPPRGRISIFVGLISPCTTLLACKNPSPSTSPRTICSQHCVPTIGSRIVLWEKIFLASRAYVLL